MQNDINRLPPGRKLKPAKPSSHARPAPPPKADPIPDLPPGEYTFTPPPTKQKRFNRNVIKNFIGLIQVVVGAVLLALFINHFILQSYQVVGRSMVPTLHDGDRLIISKIGKSWASLTRGRYIPKRGEIIVLHNPRDPSTQLIKRVIAIEGDHIIVNDGEVTVCPAEDPDNCYDPNQAYGLELDPAVGNVNLTVPEDNVFVMGDNRGPGGSLDSRNELGVVPIKLIVGDLILRIMPIDDAKLFL